MNSKIFLFALLLSLSASAQTPLPARQVSVDTNAFGVLSPSVATVQASLDWLDDHWSVLSSAGWTNIAPETNTAQSALDWVDANLGFRTNGWVSVAPSNGSLQSVLDWQDANWPPNPVRDLSGMLSAAPGSLPRVVLTGAGGGEFIWSWSASKADHDGAMTIDPDHGGSPNAAGWYVAENSGTGCYLRVAVDGLVKPEYWFVESGTTNDYRPAFDGLFNWINDRGGSVRVEGSPGSTYRLNGGDITCRASNVEFDLLGARMIGTHRVVFDGQPSAAGGERLVENVRFRNAVIGLVDWEQDPPQTVSVTRGPRFFWCRNGSMENVRQEGRSGTAFNIFMCDGFQAKNISVLGGLSTSIGLLVLLSDNVVIDGLLVDGAGIDGDQHFVYGLQIKGGKNNWVLNSIVRNAQGMTRAFRIRGDSPWKAPGRVDEDPVTSVYPWADLGWDFPDDRRASLWTTVRDCHVFNCSNAYAFTSTEARGTVFSGCTADGVGGGIALTRSQTTNPPPNLAERDQTVSDCRIENAAAYALFVADDSDLGFPNIRVRNLSARGCGAGFARVSGASDFAWVGGALDSPGTNEFALDLRGTLTNAVFRDLTMRNVAHQPLYVSMTSNQAPYGLVMENIVSDMPLAGTNRAVPVGRFRNADIFSYPTTNDAVHMANLRISVLPGEVVSGPVVVQAVSSNGVVARFDRYLYARGTTSTSDTPTATFILTNGVDVNPAGWVGPYQLSGHNPARLYLRGTNENLTWSFPLIDLISIQTTNSAP